jgi:hypothetical protein
MRNACGASGLRSETWGASMLRSDTCVLRNDACGAGMLRSDTFRASKVWCDASGAKEWR